MPKKKGPPYPIEDLDCKLIVVENPWPAGHGGPTGAARSGAFYQEVGAWLRYALNKAEYPEIIYSRNTRSEIIVQFRQDVDISPLLGSHFWPHFHRRPGCKQWISYIFEFNYVQQGHPENHNWAIHELDACDPPDWNGYAPFKQPYPAPAWVNVREAMIASRDLALPIPLPDEEPFPPPGEAQAKPKPETRPSERAKIDQSSVFSFANAMEERRPKTEESADPLPPRSRDVQAAAQRVAEPSDPARVRHTADPRGRPAPVGSGSGDKADPYEQEAAAARLLKAEPDDRSTHSLHGRSVQQTQVKGEQAQGPSPGLLAAFDSLQKSREGTAARSSAEVKPEARDEGPSAELLAAMQDYSRSRHQSAAVKPEPSESAFGGAASTSSRYSNNLPGRQRATALDLWSDEPSLPSRPRTSGSSYDNPSREHYRSETYDPHRGTRRVKRENDSEWDTGVKRQRRGSGSSR